MKLSDYVIDVLMQQGVKHVFMLPGGGAMHLNDSLGKRREKIEFVPLLHEQAVSIATEAYAKVTNKLSVAMVTSGPAGTNAVTGVAGAWLDSMPCLFVSGQVKRADLKTGTQLRQLGSQEVDIVNIVHSITKYAVTITEPQDIRYHLEKALYLATHGRPGPVWIDIPLDVQAASIEPSKLKGFFPELDNNRKDQHQVKKDVETLIFMLERAERPVLVVGNGIRVAHALEEFHQLLKILNIPVLTTWLGMDLISEEDPLFGGRPGSIAPRGANFALQNADLMIVIGSRLDMAFTGYAHDKMAPGAKKVMIDIDEAEIKKMKTKIHLPIVADAKIFILEFLKQLQRKSISWDFAPWINRVQEWKKKYPVVLEEHRNISERVSIYHFSEILAQQLPENSLIVSGSSGTAVELFLLAFAVKKGERIFHTRGLGSMGFGLPAAIGACLAANRQETICVDGDGGFQMNIQELAMVNYLQLPIKFFVLNNNGYASIRSSQQNYFQRLVAADKESGLGLPDLQKVAAAYGLATCCIDHQKDLGLQIRKVLAMKGPVLCEVMTLPDEQRKPRLSSMQLADGSMVSKPLEDLWPFLDREEFLSNMIIPTLEDA